MAGKLFLGFDFDKATNTTMTIGVAPNQTTATQWANCFCRPTGVYHNKGAATLDPTIAPPADCGQPTFYGCFYTGRVAGGAYGAVNGGGGYGAATATTRATWVTAQGHQLAFNRSELGIGGEIWMTADVMAQIPNSTLSTAYTPTNTWAALFKWGDVEIYFKQTTWSGSSHTLIFSIRNNGVEVATHTTALYTVSYTFVKLHVKLDATTGLIEMVVNNVAQSVSYTGQNTVQTTSLASATNILFGPPIADNGTTAYVGFIDNIYVDDAAYPTGRINIATFALLADDTLTNFTAVGTSPTTVVNALGDQTDAKAARALTSTGTAILTQTPPTTTSYLTDVIGIEMVAKRTTNRDASVTRRLEMGYTLGGVETVGTLAKGTTLPLGIATTPPETAAASAFPVEQIFTKTGGGNMTKTELATMKVLLRATVP